MLESAAPSLSHEFTAPKAVLTAPKAERKNFTSLPPSVQGGSIDEIVKASIEDSEAQIAAAKERAGKTESVESPPPLSPMSKPIAAEAPQQLPPGVSPEALARLQGQVANKSMTMEQAQAELEQMVTKAIGAPSEEQKPPPIKKPVAIEKIVPAPSQKASSAPPTSGESKFPGLRKIKNMFGKVWDSITSFLKGITSWITK